MVESFEVAVLCGLVRTDLLDDCSDTVDVVCENYAAHCFEEDHAQGLARVTGYNVTKTHCQHDGCRPVVSPDILFAPFCFNQTPTDEPVVFLIDSGHRNQKECQNMRKDKVKHKDFNQGPNLLSVFVFNQRNFKMLHDVN